MIRSTRNLGEDSYLFMAARSDDVINPGRREELPRQAVNLSAPRCRGPAGLRGVLSARLPRLPYPAQPRPDRTPAPVAHDRAPVTWLLALACPCGPFADALAVSSHCTTSRPPSGLLPRHFQRVLRYLRSIASRQELDNVFQQTRQGHRGRSRGHHDRGRFLRDRHRHLQQRLGHARRQQQPGRRFRIRRGI